MPAVRLSRYECRQNLLPDVCMFCGEPATQRVRRNFGWHPGWVWILILLSPLIALIVALILTKRMTVPVPACSHHAGYWTRKTLILLGTFLLVACIGVGSAIIHDPNGQGPLGDLSGALCVGSVVLVVCWLFLAAIYGSRGVRPTEITDSEISLAGVHADFVRALKEERRHERSERGRYGDERDDYDDEVDDVDRRTPRDRDRDRGDDDEDPAQPRRQSRYD